MNRRSFLKDTGVAGLAAAMPIASSSILAQTTAPMVEKPAHNPNNPNSPEHILLKDYRPKSIYKIPITEVAKAKFPIIDMHSHPYAKTAQEIAEWVRTMDEVGIEKTIILAMATGENFSDIHRKYSAYPGRFEIWCGF